MVKTLRGYTGQRTLRPATLDDVVIAADLDSFHDPDDARDPAIIRHW